MSGFARTTRSRPGGIGYKDVVDGDVRTGRQEGGHMSPMIETRKSWLSLLNFMRFLRRGHQIQAPGELV